MQSSGNNHQRRAEGPSAVALRERSGASTADEGGRAQGGTGGALAAEGGLGTSANNAGEIAKRRERFRLRRLAAEVSGAPWLADCGRKSVRKGGVVGLRGGSGSPAGFSGVDTCGSWSSCPSCAAKIGASRADDLAEVLRWATSHGHHVAMLTLTARHHKGQSLESLWDGLSGAWRHLGRGWGSETERAYRARLARHEAAWIDYEAGVRPRRPREPKPRRIGPAERIGSLGYVRATEVTHGAAGWHCHFHVVLVLRGDVIADEDFAEQLEAFRQRVFGLWQAGLRKAGLSAVATVREADGSISNVGADLRVMHGAALAQEIGGYLTKTTDAAAGAQAARALAGEATLGQFKKGRQGGRSPFEILGAVAETGDADDADLWHEWVRVSRGRRQMVWSRALREMAGLAAEERTDEEIASDEFGDVDVLVLPRDTWRDLRDDSARRFDLLQAVERKGRGGAARLLDAWGLVYLSCDDEGRPVRERAIDVRAVPRLRAS